MPRPALASLAVALAALVVGKSSYASLPERWPLGLTVVFLCSLDAADARAEDDSFCSTVTTCLKDGSETCTTATDDCPPCIYTLADSYSCWEKDNTTNTCPFTGVRYDCSTCPGC